MIDPVEWDRAAAAAGTGGPRRCSTTSTSWPGRPAGLRVERAERVPQAGSPDALLRAVRA